MFRTKAESPRGRLLDVCRCVLVLLFCYGRGKMLLWMLAKACAVPVCNAPHGKQHGGAVSHLSSVLLLSVPADH